MPKLREMVNAIPILKSTAANQSICEPDLCLPNALSSCTRPRCRIERQSQLDPYPHPPCPLPSVSVKGTILKEPYCVGRAGWSHNRVSQPFGVARTGWSHSRDPEPCGGNTHFLLFTCMQTHTFSFSLYHTHVFSLPLPSQFLTLSFSLSSQPREPVTLTK